MHQSQFFLRQSGQLQQRLASAAAIAGGLVLLRSAPALAHHPLGGMVPTTVFQGLLSGLAHPVIGLDHLAFVVAIGLFAVARPLGWLLPLVFMGAALIGTSLHWLAGPVPGLEWLVAGSVLAMGGLLARQCQWSVTILAGLAAIAGLCHGYAYGAAILGAEMTPLVAYLAGFTLIQLIIAFSAYGLGRLVTSGQATTRLQSAGWVIIGIGLTLGLTLVVDTLLLQLGVA